jgi:hypothetical protein
MGQLSFAVDEPASAAGRVANVVPFKTRRRASSLLRDSAAQQDLSEGIVVRFLRADGEGAAPRRVESITKRQADSSGTGEQHFTPFDFVATAFLILSVFAAPALVWTMLRSVSLG